MILKCPLKIYAINPIKGKLSNKHNAQNVIYASAPNQKLYTIYSKGKTLIAQKRRVVAIKYND